MAKQNLLIISKFSNAILFVVVLLSCLNVKYKCQCNLFSTDQWFLIALENKLISQNKLDI